MTPEYPPTRAFGGIGTHAATAAGALAGRGHDVTVITSGEPGMQDEQGVRVLRLEHRRLPAFLPKRDLLERFLAQIRIAWACHRARPDLVQSVEWQAQAWLIARLGRIPVVTRLATPTFMVHELNEEPDDQTTVVRWMERDQTRRSDIVYAPTRTIATVVGRRWGIPEDAIAIVPNPLDLEGTRSAGSVAPSIPLPTRSIVFIGRLERRKGIGVLGRALPRVLLAHPDVEVLLIGREVGGPDSDLMCEFREAVKSVGGRVRQVGEMARPDALAIVARATVVVLPSLWESFGYVCVEAMALGRPVVATEGNGMAEIIDDGESGVLVAPGDAEALASALIDLLGDRSKRERLGAAAAVRAEDFSDRRITAAIEALHRRAVGATRSTSRWGRRTHRGANDPSLDRGQGG